MTTAMTALHLGAMHTHEQLLVLLIAFGPLLVVVALVHVLRRRDLARQSREPTSPPEMYDGRGSA